MPRVPYTGYPDLGPQQVPGPRIDIPPSSNILAFGGGIGAAEEKLGAGIAQVGESAANIQNLQDEVSVNKAVTANFDKIDRMNGAFEQQPGDVQKATLTQHIQGMIDATNQDSSAMSVNQKIMFQRQTLWNLRAQMSRAVTSSDAAYHKFFRDQQYGFINNQVEHMIQNLDDASIQEESKKNIADAYKKLSLDIGVPTEQMIFNQRKMWDQVGTKIVGSILGGPQKDVDKANRALNSLAPNMNPYTVDALTNKIQLERRDIKARTDARGIANDQVPLIGGDAGTTGVVVPPDTAPTEPVIPIPKVQEGTPGQKSITPPPEIRSEVDHGAAIAALNRGDYLAYSREMYAPHAAAFDVTPAAYHPGPRGGSIQGVSRGTPEVQSAITDAATSVGLDPQVFRTIASIESDNDPASNKRRTTQYKGLFQLGKEEWRKFGEGDIYDAQDNAMAAARLLKSHSDWFRDRYGRDPTAIELYMMHQQGRGFFTGARIPRGNISGNAYPGMRGQQTHASFAAGWEREMIRRRQLLQGI